MRSILIFTCMMVIVCAGQAQWTTGKDTAGTAFDSVYVPLFMRGQVYNISVYNGSATHWLDVTVGDDTLYAAGMVAVPPGGTAGIVRPTKSRVGASRNYTYIRKRFEAGGSGEPCCILVQYNAEIYAR